jgi:glutamine synthetase adenylyltransferase
MRLCSLEATMEDHLRDLRLRPDGTIDCEYYSMRARQRWAMAPRQAEQEIPAKRPFKQAKLFALAFAVATGAFWTIMLTSPPLTQAADEPVVIATAN